MSVKANGYSETQRGERGTVSTIGERSRFHDGSLQSVDAENVSRRHFVHGDNLATHEEKSILERQSEPRQLNRRGDRSGGDELVAR